MNNPKCRGCLYHGYRTDTCDYILIVGRRRGCPVESCDKYESGKCARELSKILSGLGGARPSDEELVRLYEQGFSDKDIAVAIGKSRSLVAHWRRKLGLPCQREIEVDARED